MESSQAPLAPSGGLTLSGGLLTATLLSCHPSPSLIHHFVQIHAVICFAVQTTVLTRQAELLVSALCMQPCGRWQLFPVAGCH